MFPLQRSSSFLAYTYESDQEDEDEDQDCFSQLCGCQDDLSDDESDESPLCMDENTRLIPSTASRKQMAKARRKQSPDRRWFGTTVLALSVLVFCCEYYFLIWRSGEDSGTVDALGVTSSAETFLFPTVAASNDWRNTTATARFSTTEYGEVWLIRHGEKDPVSRFASDHPSESERSETLRTMYELSPKGWDRAHHLSELVKQGKWPLFSSLFASRPATIREALDAYPDFARDATGQSLVKREYQTLLPISEYLQRVRHGSSSNYKIDSNSTEYGIMIRSQFAKGEVEEAGLEIAKTAIRFARERPQNDYIAAGPNTDGNKKALGSPIVLVSWDHCSLPTLIVRGLGCRASNNSADSTSNNHQEDLRCYRCWSDDRFGDVLKLNVSLITTTTITTVATKEDAKMNFQTKKIVSHDYKVSSTILAMTGEAYPSDQYYKESDNPNKSSSSSSSSNNFNNDAATKGRTLSTVTPMSIEKSTPCIQSYCTARPAAKRLVKCSCWNE